MNTVFLYGPPASGKTTLGQQLAARLSAPFLDLDAEIEKAAGKSVAEIFAEKKGEEHFRSLEGETLKKLFAPPAENAKAESETDMDASAPAAEEPPLRIVALGGGTLLDEKNRAFAEANGTVVCLRVADDILKKRIAEQDGKRPLAPDAAAVERLLADRTAHYASFPLRYDVPEDLGKDWKDAYARMAADFDNFRKRTARDRDELAKFAASDILKDLLATADNLSLALEKAEPEDPFVKGVRLAYDGFLKALADHGATPLDSVGEPFDANFHEALAQLPSDTVEEGKIVNEVKKGWLLNGKLLRAAQVVVSSGKANG